ncbi:MAG TPA: nucleotidyltransferase family protein [Gemmatimonadaceae bacterium]|nr:nucleotidyltransferase family protein [Gemmatimonadaceae bacterium]
MLQALAVSPVIPSPGNAHVISDDRMEQRLRDAIVAPGTPLTEALKSLDANGMGVLLLAKADRRLVGIITDGDVRRHILSGAPLTVSCESIASRHPRVATRGMSTSELLDLMGGSHDDTVDHLPILTDDGIVVGLVLRRDLVAADDTFTAVIMAGGYGKRLMPLTTDTPKPLLPVGDRPLMERTIERLRRAGIRRVNVATHYLSDKISNHFGDGRQFGVEMRYVTEDRPLGTAGALRLMEPPTGPLLVVNGDILTGVNYQDMLAYHRENGAIATVGVRKYDVEVPYGVIDCSGVAVSALREKPMQQFLVNAGMYLLDPAAVAYIPEGERFDMTDLIQRLLAEGRKVVAFPVVEYWLDIGKPADYERAQQDVLQVRA